MIVRNCWGSSTPRVLKALAREGLYLAILLAGSRQQGKTSTFGGAVHLGQRADTDGKTTTDHLHVFSSFDGNCFWGPDQPFKGFTVGGKH